MDRYDEGSRVVVNTPKNVGNVLLILVIVIVIVGLILLFLFARRQFGSTSTSIGTGSLECANDADCTGNQVCDTGNGVCVECVVDGNCPIQRPLCSPVTHKCVGCLDSGDCPGSKPICDPTSQICVQCSSSNDCGGAAPFCNPSTHRCVACITSGDCPSQLPICNPGNNTCVECLSNANCTSPATCNSGLCCDTSAPTIIGITASIGATPTFTGTYLATQSLAGVVAVFEVADSTGFVLFTSGGSPANGSISIVQPATNSYPTYYSGYQYQIRAKLISSCGATPYSAPFMSTMVYPPPGPNFINPIIDSASASAGGFAINMSSPDASYFFYYQAKVHISTTPYLDPNRATVTTNINIGCNTVMCDDLLRIVGVWPFPVISGQTYYLRVVGMQGVDFFVASPPAMVTIP